MSTEKFISSCLFSLFPHLTFFLTSSFSNKIVVYKLLPQALHPGELQLMNPNLDIYVVFIWLSCVYLKCFSRVLPIWQVYSSPLTILIFSKLTHIFWASLRGNLRDLKTWRYHSHSERLQLVRKTWYTWIKGNSFLEASKQLFQNRRSSERGPCT